MSRKPANIISYSVPMPAASQAGDFHDVSGHHRYYGSSACNGGERLSETRWGRPPSLLAVFGFQNLG
jgi:hypothetical protein